MFSYAMKWVSYPISQREAMFSFPSSHDVATFGKPAEIRTHWNNGDHQIREHCFYSLFEMAVAFLF